MHTARVLGVSAASMSSTVGLSVYGSTSQKTGTAPVAATALAADTKLTEGRTTSSPRFNISSSMARKSPAVALLRKSTLSSGTPIWAANSFSNPAVRAPCPGQLSEKTSARAWSSSCPRLG